MSYKIQITLDVTVDETNVDPVGSSYQLAVEIENLAEAKDGVQQAVATIQKPKEKK